MFLLWPSLFIISPLFHCSILDTYWPGGAHLLVSYLFAFSLCSWSSQGKTMEVVCHSLLWWAMFSQALRDMTLTTPHSWMTCPAPWLSYCCSSLSWSTHCWVSVNVLPRGQGRGPARVFRKGVQGSLKALIECLLIFKSSYILLPYLPKVLH